jgi:methionyl-tRNA formyltransferase
MIESLRIVSFNVFPEAYEMVSSWAANAGHQIILLVTSPSPRGERYGAGHRELIAMLPAQQDVLVSSRLRRTVAPVLAALSPDLIISASFPHRIPPAVTGIPRYGAVNLHPAPLPRGRGPNPQRLIYEGDLTVTGTLHRIVPEFDAGAILSQRERRLPDDVSGEAIFAAWKDLLAEALDEGVARAVSGEPGETQEEALATYAAPFTEAEYWLDWDEPARTIQRRAAALNMFQPLARAYVDGQPMHISHICAHPGMVPAAIPGTVVSRNGDTITIQVADGTVEVSTAPLGDAESRVSPALGDGHGMPCRYKATAAR